MEIPIVNLSAVCEKVPQREDWLATGIAFGRALQNIGFVYLSHHGISQEKIDAVFSASRTFYGLDQETKLKYQRDFQTTFHGYTQVGGERFSKGADLELREMFDAALADAEAFSNCPYPDEEVPEFRVAMRDLMKECQEAVFKILKLLAIALDLEDEDFFIGCHNNLKDSSIPNFTQLRTLFYPPVPESVTPRTVRCSPHADYGTVTLLFQDSMGGLEIKSVAGTWIPAHPMPGCLVINAGNLLDIWTAGRFPSTIHRVVIPENEIKKQTARQSIALFVKPDNTTLVSALGRRKGEQEGKSDIAERSGGSDLPEKVYPGELFQNLTLHHHQLATATDSIKAV